MISYVLLILKDCNFCEFNSKYWKLEIIEFEGLISIINISEFANYVNTKIWNKRGEEQSKAIAETTPSIICRFEQSTNNRHKKTIGRVERTYYSRIIKSNLFQKLIYQAIIYYLNSSHIIISSFYSDGGCFLTSFSET